MYLNDCNNHPSLLLFISNITWVCFPNLQSNFITNKFFLHSNVDNLYVSILCFTVFTNLKIFAIYMKCN